jgi:hypothetical protein
VSNMYATTSFSVFVTALGHDDHLLQGCMRDSASAVVTQVPSLFSATPPARGSIPNPLFDYLQVNPAGVG